MTVAVAALAVAGAAVAVTGAQGASAAPGRTAAQVGQAAAPAASDVRTTMEVRESRSGRVLDGDDGRTFAVSGYSWSVTAAARRPIPRAATRWTFSVTRPSGVGSTSLVQAFRSGNELDVTISLETPVGEGTGPSTTYALRRCIVTGFTASAADAGPQDDLTFDCAGGVRVDVRTVLPNGSLGPTRTEVLTGGPRG